MPVRHADGDPLLRRSRHSLWRRSLAHAVARRLWCRNAPSAQREHPGAAAPQVDGQGQEVCSGSIAARLEPLLLVSVPGRHARVVAALRSAQVRASNQACLHSRRIRLMPDRTAVVTALNERARTWGALAGGPTLPRHATTRAGIRLFEARAQRASRSVRRAWPPRVKSTSSSRCARQACCRQSCRWPPTRFLRRAQAPVRRCMLSRCALPRGRSLADKVLPCYARATGCTSCTGDALTRACSPASSSASRTRLAQRRTARSAQIRPLPMWSLRQTLQAQTLRCGSNSASKSCLPRSSQWHGSSCEEPGSIARHQIMSLS